ncbi:type III secretion system inner membrane ring subunit SctD [Dickeya zeae]|uniref:type III secretion system inner membrane ring subunit SctD n=1 Tax=Dickeya zeae TaxID=204042 RepID=UPI000C9B5D83|nr:type III secretion system inner membrane ring subunit SctD [Dickeya zeae]AUQ25690.1 EscD/YscD/HrpQ family type III secretion system inner membrane ring protein [Dickeya zeae]UJR58762.1 type III secretion system inner membrane ring subunit SctD [Dickeya zeae]
MFELRVLTGLHRGAALPLSGTSWRIGSADEADMVLYDPGIREQHCLLEASSDGWQVCVLDGPVSNSEGHNVEQSLILPPGTPFAVGAIWLCVVSADTPWQDDTSATPSQDASRHDRADIDADMPTVDTDIVVNTHQPSLPEAATACQEKRHLPLWAKFSYLLLGVLLFMIVGSWMLQETAAMPPAPSPQDNRLPVGTLPQLNSTLQTMLTDRELERLVTLSQDNNRIVLSGALLPAQHTRLARMLAQFHQRYVTALQIENRTTEKTDGLPFQIVQVTSGPKANIVTADGRRLFVGDEVDNLRLVSINDSQIEFRGKQQIKVNW